MLCSARWFQALAFLVSIAIAWVYAVDIFAPDDRLIRGLIAWVGGSLLFLLVMVIVYGIESIVRPGCRR